MLTQQMPTGSPSSDGAVKLSPTAPTGSPPETPATQEQKPEEKPEEGKKSDLEEITERQRRHFREKHQMRLENKKLMGRLEEMEKALKSLQSPQLQAGTRVAPPPHQKQQRAQEEAPTKDGNEFQEFLNEFVGKDEKNYLTKEEVASYFEEFMNERDAKVNQQRQAQEAQQKAQEVEKNFHNEIGEFLKSSAQKYPMSSTVASSRALIAQKISESYEELEKEYGEDYAWENKLSFDKAAALVEKELDAELDGLLQSEHMTQALISKLKAKGIQLNSNQQGPSTLSNEFHGSGHGSLSEEERLRRAKAIPFNS